MTNFTVANGVTSSGLVLGPADTLTVQPGGTASGNVLLGTMTTIENGGAARSDVVTDDARETVDGMDSFSTVAGGGVITIQSDGGGFYLNVLAGGELIVNGPAAMDAETGETIQATIATGGLMEVQSNGLALVTTLNGGELIVASGSATDTQLFGGLELVTGAASVDSGGIVLSGAVQQAVSSGLISGTTISFGGSAVAETGGMISGATVSSGGTTIEQLGGVASNTAVAVGATDSVGIGGSAVSATVDGLQYVSGGSVTGTVINDGGTLDLLGGGVASGIFDTGFVDVVSASLDGGSIGNGEFGGSATVGLGGLITAVTVNRFGILTLVDGGVAQDLTVFGLETISAGGVDVGAVIGIGGSQVIRAGGIGSGTIVESGGTETVSSGGIAFAATVATSGAIVVSFGGSAVADSGETLTSATVSSGGVTIESAGGSGAGNTVLAGGLDVVSSGGVAYEEYVLGEQIVLSGGLASGDPTNFTVAIESGGLQLVSGGKAINMNVSAGGVELVVSSGLGSATYISSGGSAVTETGGLLDGIGVFSGGFSVERYFGSALDTTIDLGGTDVVSSTGIAISAQVAGLQVLSGGTTGATTVSGGGKQVISAGGIASGTFVSSGGIETVSAGGVVHGATVSSGGRLVVEAGATVQGTVTGLGLATLELAGGTGTLAGMTGGSVTVAGVTTAAAAFTNFGKLQIDANASFTAAGTETVSNARSLTIDGTLTATGTLTVAGSLTVGGSATGARTLAGTGTLALAAGTTTFSTGGLLTIAHVTQSGTAAVNVSETALTYAKVWTQTAGTITVGAAHTLSFTGSGDRFSGTLTGGGQVRFTGGTDLLSGTTLSAAGTVINGAAVTLAGAISMTKTVTVTSPDLTIAATGATLSGFGTLTLTNLATNKIVGATAAATLINASDTIIGAGDLGGGSMTLVNQAGGSIKGDSASVALTIDTGANTITNAGGIISEGKGGVVIKSAVDNTGTLTVTQGTLSVQGAVTGAGTVDIQAGTAHFGSSFGENVTFGGASGQLMLTKSQSYAGTITGFTLGMELDLRDIAWDNGAASAFWSGNGGGGGVLTVTNGSQSANIKLNGDYGTGSGFNTAEDSSGGTLLFIGAQPTAAPKHPAVPGFIAAMASYDPGGGHWVPTAESGRTPQPLLAAATGR